MLIHYSISSNQNQGIFPTFLTVRHPLGVLHGQDRGKLLSVDRPFADKLIAEHKKYKPLKSASLEEGLFSNIYLPNPSPFLMDLARTQRVYYKDKKLVIDPLSTCKLFFDITLEGDDLLIEPFIIDGTSQIPLSQAEAFFGEKEMWVLHKGVLKRLKTEGKWLTLALTTPLLSGRKKENFLDHYSDNGLPLDSSIPEAKFHKQKSETVTIKPLIEMKDERGLFLKLFFEYGAKGIFPFLDRSNPFLNEEEERFWEKELMNAGIKKMGPEYFISAPLQEKIFRGLISSGWHIQDGKKRTLSLFSKAKGLIADEEDKAVLSLEIEFNDHVAPIDELIASRLRKSPLVILDEKHVGLLPISLFEELGVLLKGQRREKGLYFDPLMKGDLQIAQLEVSSKLELDIPRDALKEFPLTLLPFQTKGVAWLLYHLKKHQGVLLADDMGLGKTIQAFALIKALEGTIDKKVLVVCPKSIKPQWQKGVETYLQNRVPVEVVHFHELRNQNFDESYSLVIIDEAQAIKNAKTQLFEKVMGLKTDFKLALSGTPIENRIQDLVSLFQFLSPKLVLDFANVSAQLNLEKIKRRLSPFILRREKKEVLIDLPPLFEQVSETEMDPLQAALYFNTIQDAKKEPVHPFALITKLRQIALDPRLVQPSYEGGSSKTECILEDIQSLAETGHKVLVFSQFTQYLSLLKRLLEEEGLHPAYLDGKTENREEVLDDFRKNKSILLMSLKAGGVGLNLQEADYVLITDPWWNEAVEKQAIDRAHRLGRKEAVIARRYLALGTLEKKIEELKASKWALFETLIDNPGSLPQGVLEKLIEI